MDSIVNAQATDAMLPPNNTNPPDDVVDVNSKYKIPLVFMRETELFGNRRPEKNEWIQHIELYRAIGRKIDVSHISGLQRVRGLWRIYLDNIEDKVTLMAEGIPLRGKSIPVLSTNPDRFDGEQTIRIRVKNIPLSVEDGLIKRTITLKEAEVISMYREKLRVDNKLTNCETGDRVVIVKASSLKEPLPFSMTFGHFVGRVIHIGQQKSEKSENKTCSKCLQDGHSFRACTNDWVCTNCNEEGHKRADCKAKDRQEQEEADSSESEASESESSEDDEKEQKKSVQKQRGIATDVSSEQKPTHTRVKKSAKKSKHNNDSRQQSIERYVTPKKGASSIAQERSPPTPVETLHDKHMQSNTAKKHKQK